MLAFHCSALVNPLRVGRPNISRHGGDRAARNCVSSCWLV